MPTPLVIAMVAAVRLRRGFHEPPLARFPDGGGVEHLEERGAAIVARPAPLYNHDVTIDYAPLLARQVRQGHGAVVRVAEHKTSARRWG